MDVISSGTGVSMMFGNAAELLSNPDSFVMDMRSTNQSNGEFTVNSFVEMAIWLNNNVGFKNWYFDDMKYYFKTKDDLIMFRLRLNE